jgi:hypothetical protein
MVMAEFGYRIGYRTCRDMQMILPFFVPVGPMGSIIPLACAK